jgi:hypothetical protein
MRDYLHEDGLYQITNSLVLRTRGLITDNNIFLNIFFYVLSMHG